MKHVHLNLTDEQEKTFTSILNALKKEREIKRTDYDAIALLVLNMTMLEQAIDAINAEGAMVVSHTQHGQVTKKNPATELAQQCQTAMRNLFVELLMTPKSRLAVSALAAQGTPEEDDPLAAALKARAKRGS